MALYVLEKSRHFLIGTHVLTVRHHSYSVAGVIKSLIYNHAKWQIFPWGSWLAFFANNHKKIPLKESQVLLNKQTSAVPNLPIVSYKALPQAQLSEDVHHNLHRGVVCHCKRAHVKNASELQGSRTFCWKRWGVLRKTHSRTTNDTFLFFSGTFWKREDQHLSH